MPAESKIGLKIGTMWIYVDDRWFTRSPESDLLGLYIHSNNGKEKLISASIGIPLNFQLLWVGTLQKFVVNATLRSEILNLSLFADTAVTSRDTPPPKVTNL